MQNTIQAVLTMLYIFYMHCKIINLLPNSINKLCVCFNIKNNDKDSDDDDGCNKIVECNIPLLTVLTMLNILLADIVKLDLQQIRKSHKPE